VVNYDFGYRERKVILGKCLVQVPEVHTNANLLIFLLDWDNIGHPFRCLLFPYEAHIDELICFLHDFLSNKMQPNVVDFSEMIEVIT
jgi:hypothetical protein